MLWDGDTQKREGSIIFRRSDGDEGVDGPEAKKES